jgi:hypothetical protein
MGGRGRPLPDLRECTMVCPTCFCSTVEDVTDLQGEHAERWRKWDSCFTMSHSHVVGERPAFCQIAVSPVDDSQAGDLD